MPYDATKMKDWQIAEAAEENMPPPDEWRERLNLQKDEVIPYGRLSRLDFMKIIERLKQKPDGRYIEVTAITPTPLGEGKSTTSMGLMEGMGKRGKNVGGCLRQPSGGPTMNIKGTAAGGGNALLIPMTEFSMGLTGDINDIMNAHNLAMVALTARMQHERNYDDAELAKRNLRRLDVDPTRVEMGWIMDFCAQSLRNIIIGIGGRMDGFLMQSKFGIAVSSELMAMLSIVRDLADLRERMDKINIGTRVTPYPMPVTFVGTLVDSRVNFMTVAWINRMNNNPPIWGAGIGKHHLTVKGIEEQRAFSINLPSVDMLERTDYCGLGSGTKIDKSEVFEVFYGELGNAPMIQECPLTIECKLHDTIDLPTHLLVLGEVVAAYTDDRYLTDGKVDVKKVNPVVLTMPDNRYWAVGDYLAQAWNVGKKLIR